jgi:molybdopterin/thiamine biosynthesis adenylyltransferase
MVGQGSGGSAVTNMLAKAGVKRFTLFDPDELSGDNLKRHVLGPEYVGKSKVEGMEAHIRSINPDCQVRALKRTFGWKLRLPRTRWLGLEPCLPRKVQEDAYGFTAKPDLIVSCVDSLACESLINAYSLAENVPVVYGGVHGAARVAEIIYVIPGKTPCYECYEREGPLPEPTQEHYTDPNHDPTKMPSMPGLWGDVLLAASLQFQVILGVLGLRPLPAPLTLFNIHEQPLFKAEFWNQKPGCAICTDNMEGLCR